MKTTLLASALIAFGAVASAHAQTATPAPAPAPAATPAPAAPSAPAAPAASAAAPAAAPTPASIAATAPVPSTKAFIETAAAANGFEIASSKLAIEKSKNKDIIRFAKHMVKDHTKIGKNFMAALKKANAGVTPAPGLGPDLDAIMTRLKGEDGATFDADYVAAQTKGHQDAVALFAGYAKGGDNKVMQAFAKKTLPMIEMHLDMCYKLAAKMKKQS